MRKGKVAENIVNRSVFKTIKYRDREYVEVAQPGDSVVTAECQNVVSKATAGLMFSGDLWIGDELFLFDIRRAFFNALSNVVAEGGRPRAVLVSLYLPAKAQERDIKELMRYISSLAQENQIDIAGGETEVTGNITSPVISFTAMGPLATEVVADAKKLSENMDIVMAGYSGIAGSVATTYLKIDELRERFSKTYLNQIFAQEKYMDMRNLVCAWNHGVRMMHDTSRGGVYGALFELSSKAKKGIRVELDMIPILQETVEVCELYDMNPYKLLSNGGMLMVAEHGEELCAFLEEQEIPAVVIGKLTEDNAKAVIKNGEISYIEPPRKDEISLVLQ